MKALSKLGVRAKLLLAFLLVCALMSAVTGYAIVQLSLSNARMKNVHTENLLPIVALTTTQQSITDLQLVAATTMLRNEKTALDEFEKQLKITRGAFENHYLKTVVEQATSKEEQAMVAELSSLVPQYMESTQNIFQLLQNEKRQEALAAFSSVSLKSETLDALFDREIEFNVKYAEDVQKAGESAYLSTLYFTCGLLAGILTIATVIGWYIAGWFTRALVDVSAIADEVAAASHQLAAAADELSSGSQEQASSLEETASSLEEITSTIQQNSDNAQQANQLAGNSRQVAENGGDVVSRAVQGMGEINSASKRIADIITAIDEIAFQTNLLALNAAVEAARAGEQGRGFAVVAGEVRNLAQRSAAAAKEIKSLIQDSVSKVNVGSELVNESGRTLGDIVTSVKRVTDIVSEIAAASREQASGIEQVNRAVTEMDQVVQTNAAQTEELSATAEQLAEKASQLQQVVSQFNLHRNNSHTPMPRQTKSSRPTSFRNENYVRGGRPTSSARRRDETSIEHAVEQELELIAAGSSGRDRFENF